MDQSPQEVALVRGYGGSDTTQPSFNRPRYVRYASIHEPKDFGVVEFLRLDIEGDIGAQSGSQTLFFRFTTTKPARIGLRRVSLNRYTDQYVSISLRNGNGEQIPLGIDGFANSQIIDVTGLELLAPEPLDVGYVDCGYWFTGYAQYDCFKLIFPPRIFSGDPDDPFDSVSGELLPAGQYTFVVSSSQWPQVPYRIQAVVSPQVELAGTADIDISGFGRLALADLAGVADLEITPTGRLIEAYDLEGLSDLEIRPQATLNRQSPFG
jgi:hypothetical protein